MPPAILWQAGTPCSRSQCATFKLRTPWWQKKINVVSSALASSCCKLAGMSRMGIKVAPSMRVMANSSGSRTSISSNGSPASIRRWMSSGPVSIGRIVSRTNLRIAQWKIVSLPRSNHSAMSRPNPETRAQFCSDAPRYTNWYILWPAALDFVMSLEDTPATQTEAREVVGQNQLVFRFRSTGGK